MRSVEYGAQNPEAIVLLHGGGLSCWNYREASKLLEKQFHVILPILDGHAGSDAPFVSIEENAAKKYTFEYNLVRHEDGLIFRSIVRFLIT